MDGGGAFDSEEFLKLGNISQIQESIDLIPIGVSALVGLDVLIGLNKSVKIGGSSLNAFFDTFGLESSIVVISWMLLLFQGARWAYTRFYASAGKPWSPLVFVSILLAVQIIHDLLFKFGLLDGIPNGQNEMLDHLKKYDKENGRKALGTHAVLLIAVAVLAMFLCEATFLTNVVLGLLGLYLLPFLLTQAAPKAPAPPPKAPPRKEGWGGMQSYGVPQY